MVATPPTSPVLAALWSHRQPGAKHKRCPNVQVSFVCLILLVIAVSHEISYGLLATSNGRIVSFLKSVHMVNYYWPKSRLSARSLVGCTLLKFVGSSLISFALGEGLLIASPRHLLSFVCAFSLVRSDSVEATQLSRLLRHSVPLHLLLNMATATYKLRKLGFLVAAAPPVIGSLGTVLLGTAAFSAANFIMKLESLVLSVAGVPLLSPPLRPAKAAVPVPAAAAAAAAAATGDAAAAGSLPPLITLPAAAAVPPTEPAGGSGDLAASMPARTGTGGLLPRVHAAAPLEERRETGPVEPPNMPKAVLQNFCLIASLVLGERCGQLVAVKLLVLLFLCCYYNKNLWYRGLLRMRLLAPSGVSPRASSRSRSMLSLGPQLAVRADAYPVGVPFCRPGGLGSAPGLVPERAKQE